MTDEPKPGYMRDYESNKPEPYRASPWDVDTDLYYSKIIDNNGYTICTIDPNSPNSKVGQATIQLIKHAPEMFETLDRLMDAISEAEKPEGWKEVTIKISQKTADEILCMMEEIDIDMNMPREDSQWQGGK